MVKIVTNTNYECDEAVWGRIKEQRITIIMDDLDNITSIATNFAEILSGNPFSIPEFIAGIKKEYNSLSDQLIIYMLESVFNGLDEKGTLQRKVGKILAKSEYSSKYSYALLRYIHSCEHEDKGKYFAYLIDAASKQFITGNECFYYIRDVSTVSLEGLHFIKNRINGTFTAEIYDTADKMYIINELLRNNLMYETNNSSYYFELEAFYLDKFSLSYESEKYGDKYDEKDAGIPDLSSFPNKPAAFSTEGGEKYRSKHDRNVLRMATDKDVKGILDNSNTAE